MNLRIGGVVWLSTGDYPDHLSAVVFCQGCPWRCGYCHNPHLLPRRATPALGWSDIRRFLERRRGLLDAVVFSGGEPTLQAALPDALAEVRSLGYRTALHTAGISPKRLAAALPFLDWVAMDIKTEFDRYGEITGVPGSGEHARQSMELILASGVAYEFRTTVHPALIEEDAVRRLADVLVASGVRHYVLQEFRIRGCAHSALLEDRHAGYLGDELQRNLAAQFDAFTIRRA